MKVSLFMDRDLERLRARLESGVEDDGTRMLFVRGEEKPEQDLCELRASGEGGEGTAGREGRTRLPGRPTRGKWWPLTRILAVYRRLQSSLGFFPSPLGAWISIGLRG